MHVSRRRSSVYRISRYLLPSVIALTILAAAIPLFAAPGTEIVGPRTFVIAGPDGALKTVPEEAVAGEVIIQLKPGTTPQQFQDALNRLQGQVLGAVPSCSMFKVKLPAGTSVNEGRAKWAAEPIVNMAEPNLLAYLQYVPDDPLYGNQYQWPRIDAEAAWDVQQGLGTTVVAIIDSGYDPDHEDMAGRWWQNAAEAAGTPGADDDGNGYVDDIVGWDWVENDNDPDAHPTGSYGPEQVSHGMHVAGLIGAASDNGIGVAGANWQCRLMVLRVADSQGSGSVFDILSAIDYAVANGADVINISMGGGFTTAYDPVIANAHAAGVVVVAAAGNFGVVYTDDPSTWFSPVCNDGPNLGIDNFVLGVGATDQNDVASDWGNGMATHRDASGYNFVDVMAPGTDVYSTLYHDPTLVGLENPYGMMSGTSMSCPIAAGVVALAIGQYPGFTPDQIVTLIRNTCDDISAENPLTWETLGAGRINAAAAVGVDVPPEPVTNLQAFDTPLDEGQSISITWNLSRDDGFDVVSYSLMRAEEDLLNPGSPGPFSLLVTLPPGTDNYTDTPVEDYKNFWYQVITNDAANAVPSSIAGPAFARDDLPPDPVDTLAAGDTQSDDGGSISLSWYGYNYPDDLDHYNIYRAEATFSNVSAMTPIATVNDKAVLNYIDDTTVDDTPYYYAVTGVDEDDNENPLVTAVGPVVSNPNMTFTYPAGLSIMAIGAMPATSQSRNLADIMGIQPGGDVNLAYYDPADPENPYVIFSDQPGSAFFQQALGRAWWLKTDQPILLNISGQPAPPGDFELPVVTGWNLIGNPFSQAIDFADTLVTNIGQGTPVDLATSNALGFTRDYAWGFDPFTNSYVLISGANLSFATRELGAGRGAFLLSRRPATLVLRRPVGAAAVDESPEPKPLDGWALKIVAQAAGAADVDNYLGVTSQAAQLNNIITPPRPDVDLDLYFVRPAGQQQARWATDFATAAEGRTEWRMKVACSIPGAVVKLSWPDLSQLPADCRPVLVDEATGRSIYLRTSAGYSYEVPENADEHSFVLRISSDRGVLAIGSLAVGSAGGGAQVAYTLSNDAAVDVEVLNIAGIVVRRVITGREQAAGPQQVVWDGRNASGAPVPAGTYIVRIRARAADGQQVSAVRTLQISR
ncbi:MAG: S8 family serine peptidase [Armatimonadetes bacterium]|nr:S8 family serine peptidase [Armatimonadota bacterium]